MRTVGLFGGSFDPPHAAHQLVALYALETHPLDELWLVPVVIHPHGKRLAPYADRVAMCELAARALGKRVQVSRAEEQLGAAAGHTIELIDHLRATHADTSFRLVMGADLVLTAPSWHRWPDIVSHAPPIVVGRAPHAISPAPAMPDISASEIRARLAGLDPLTRASLRAGTVTPSLASMVPRAVLRYIATHDLYT